MKKRRHFTLLEVLIALSLSAILLSGVLFFYRYLSDMSQAVNQVEIENFQARRVETRLAQVFYAIVGETFKSDNKVQPPKNPMQDKNKGQDKKQEQENPNDTTAQPQEAKTQDKSPTIVFFTGDDEGGILKSSSTSLTFIFDNGPTMNTPFSNQVLAKLFIDKQNRLCLAYWPHPKFWGLATLPPMNMEVLMENAEFMHMRFYVSPQSLKEEDESRFPELRPGEWTDQWHREYGLIPAAIKISVVYKDKKGIQKSKTFAYPLIDSKKVVEYFK